MKIQNLLGLAVLIFASTAANAQTPAQPPVAAPISHEEAGKLILTVMIPVTHKTEELRKRKPAIRDSEIDQVMQKIGATASFEKAQPAFQQAYNDAYYEVQPVLQSVPPGPNHDKLLEKALEKAQLQHGVDILKMEQSLLIAELASPDNAISPSAAYDAIKLLAKTDMLEVRFPSAEWMKIEGDSEKLRNHVLKLLAKMPMPETAKVEGEKRDADSAKNPDASKPATAAALPGKSEAK